VEMQFKAHIWDGQLQAILEFLSSDDKGEGPLEFVVNDDATVCQGLHCDSEVSSRGVGPNYHCSKDGLRCCGKPSGYSASGTFGL